MGGIYLTLGTNLILSKVVRCEDKDHGIHGRFTQLGCAGAAAEGDKLAQARWKVDDNAAMKRNASNMKERFALC
jgi:hypothetical protein